MEPEVLRSSEVSSLSSTVPLRPSSKPSSAPSSPVVSPEGGDWLSSSGSGDGGKGTTSSEDTCAFLPVKGYGRSCNGPEGAESCFSRPCAAGAGTSMSGDFLVPSSRLSGSCAGLSNRSSESMPRLAGGCDGPMPMAAKTFSIPSNPPRPDWVPSLRLLPVRGCLLVRQNS